MFTGSMLITGSLAMQRVIDGAYSWERIAHGPIRRRNRSMAMQTFVRAHMAYGVTLDIDTGLNRTVRQRVGRTVTNGRDAIVHVVHNVITNLSPDTQDPDSLLRRRADDVSPETIAAAGILRAGADGLKTPEARATGKILREAYRTMYTRGIKKEEKDRAYQTLYIIQPSLQASVRTSVAEQLPSIERMYRRPIPTEMPDIVASEAVQMPATIEPDFGPFL